MFIIIQQKMQTGPNKDSQTDGNWWEHIKTGKHFWGNRQINNYNIECYIAPHVILISWGLFEKFKTPLLEGF